MSNFSQEESQGPLQKARAVLVPNVTRLGSRYEPPLHPALVIRTQQQSLRDAVEQINQTIGLKDL